LRCLINPVTTIKYFNELCHLSQPRTLIIHRPLLPAKIQRPYLLAHSDWVSMADISPWMGLAVIAAEDQKFPEHWGFDVPAIEKAL
ncbi:transglycosylase domain-containing protein, partial [Salmonella enterica subsp. enterica serovar Kentucky]|nr:transglycosylase domain-containing protein [Salmonella enterica subsp. enterica serovar Kentucky]